MNLLEEGLSLRRIVVNGEDNMTDIEIKVDICYTLLNLTKG